MAQNQPPSKDSLDIAQEFFGIPAHDTTTGETNDEVINFATLLERARQKGWDEAIDLYQSDLSAFWAEVRRRR